MAIHNKLSENQQSDSIIFEQTSDGGTNPVVTVGNCKDATFVAIKQGEQESVVFAGISQGYAFFNRMTGVDYEEMKELLTRAVNNRTRQRNFFQLQISMLEGLITEDEFYKTLEENEDDYVVEELENPSLDRIEHALYLSQEIKDVNNSEDFANLFSFSSSTSDRELQKLDNNGSL